MIVVLCVIAAAELLVIFWMVASNQGLDSELQRERRTSRGLAAELDALRRDDGRFVDQLVERGRQEIAQLEAYYQQGLPKHQRPDDWRRST